MSQVMKCLNVAGINCCESKKSQKVTLHDSDLKRGFEWNYQWLISLTIFFTLKPIPASGYCGSLPKFEHEFDRIQIQCVKNLHLRCFDKVLNTDCLGLAHIFPSKWFFKSYLKHQSAKHFIAVFTPNYFDKNVGNVRTFKPKDLITI